MQSLAISPLTTTRSDQKNIQPCKAESLSSLTNQVVKERTLLGETKTGFANSDKGHLNRQMADVNRLDLSNRRLLKIEPHLPATAGFFC